VRISAVLLAAVSLGGCLLNTPTNVAKRFVSAVKHLQWDKMEALVDWASSERALGKPLGGDRHAVLLEVAEGISSYQISYYGEERARSNFLFFRVAETKKTKEAEDLVRVQIELRLTSMESKTFEITTRKVGRTWRVVLTPNLLEKKYMSY
jgi:hypothetical protein